jgi:transcriptional regulator with XRE-family HTH domain
MNESLSCKSAKCYTGHARKLCAPKTGRSVNMDRPISVITRELGERIAEYRLSLNLRQEDVARATGVSRSTVARLEAGGGGTLDTLVRVLKALGVDDRMGMLVPDARVRPLDKRPDAGRRKRASGPSRDGMDEPSGTTWAWGDGE